MSIVEVQQQPVAQSPEIREAMQRLNRAIEEAKALQTTERIIASVERTMMGRVLEPYDSANALEATRKSNEAIRLADLNLIKTAQDCLLDELHLWRVSVAKRDDEVMPYNLRRYCEHTNEGLDVASYAALTRFYRSRPNTNITQSKYDLVVTRMCAPPTKGGLRILRHDRQQLAMYLARLFASWDMSGSVALQTMDTSGETIDLMRGFDAFIAEANEVASIEDLVRRELFNRVRAFKSSLVDTFYEPAVSAAAIDCNVVLSNRFTTLLEAEGEQIRDAPSACRELATVFRDTSCEGAHEEMTELLAELQTEVVSSEEAAARERLTRLGALLRLA